VAEVSGIEGIRRIKDTVDDMATKDVDSIPVADIKGNFYLITIFTATQSKSLIMSIARDTSGIKDSVFSKVGSPLPAEVNAVESGGNVLLRITNPNAFSINVEVIRFILGG